jgi:hypothetical protein
MSTIEAPLKPLREWEETDKNSEPDDEFIGFDFDNVFEVAIPCECAHGVLGGHFVAGGKDCPQVATFRVVMDCQHRPRHSFNFCKTCKEALQNQGRVFSSVSL